MLERCSHQALRWIIDEINGFLNYTKGILDLKSKSIACMGNYFVHRLILT